MDGSRQVVPQNPDSLSDRPGGWHRFHKRPQAHGQPEHGATIAGSLVVGCAVERPVRRLKQPVERAGTVSAVEAVKQRERAFWGDSESRTVAVAHATRG